VFWLRQVCHDNYRSIFVKGGGFLFQHHVAVFHRQNDIEQDQIVFLFTKHINGLLTIGTNRWLKTVLHQLDVERRLEGFFILDDQDALFVGHTEHYTRKRVFIQNKPHNRIRKQELRIKILGYLA